MAQNKEIKELHKEFTTLKAELDARGVVLPNDILVLMLKHQSDRLFGRVKPEKMN